MTWIDFPKWYGRFKQVFSHRYFPIAALLIGVVFAWPSMYVGWFADDLSHRAAYVDSPDNIEFFTNLKGPMGMYSFFQGDEQAFQELLDRGVFNWWLSREIRAAFWRPITALCSMLDYRLWPESAMLMHIQSLCWYVAVILLAAMVYRILMGSGWAAGLATLLFAVNSYHAVPITFLANRHILIGAFFGLIAILCHHRWRNENRVGWAYASNGALLLSVLSSESGIVALAFLMSYALWIERGAIRSRIVSLIPYPILIAAWRLVYSSLGYGIQGLELYVDPGNDPLAFAHAVLERLPIHLISVLTLPFSNAFMILTPMGVQILWYGSIVLFVLLGLLFYPQWRHCRIALFWMTGTVFAVIPLCAAIPDGRSLAFASFGAAGAIAQIANNLEAGDSRAGFSKIWRYAVVCVMVAVLLIRLANGAGTLLLNSRVIARLQQGIDILAHIDIEDPDLSNKDLIVVNPPSAILFTYMIPKRLVAGEPIPAHLRVLASGLDSISIQRMDENTMVVHVENGYLPPPSQNDGSWTELRSYVHLLNALRRFERLLLVQNDSITAGKTIDLTGVTIEILEVTEDHRPKVVSFQFDVPLEDPSLLWYRWNGDEWRYEPLPPLQIGQRFRVSE